MRRFARARLRRSCALERLIFAVAASGQSPQPHAMLHEILHHGFRAPLAQDEVVARRAAIVGVTCDLEAQRLAALHDGGELFQHGHAVGAKLCAATVEFDARRREEGSELGLTVGARRAQRRGDGDLRTARETLRSKTQQRLTRARAQARICG
jgi:hypothetical protein